MKKPYCYVNRLIRTDADWRAALALVAPHFDGEPEIDSDAWSAFRGHADTFSLRDWDAFFAALDNADKPRPKLEAAAQAYMNWCDQSAPAK